MGDSHYAHDHAVKEPVLQSEMKEAAVGSKVSVQDEISSDGEREASARGVVVEQSEKAE